MYTKQHRNFFFCQNSQCGKPQFQNSLQNLFVWKPKIIIQNIVKYEKIFNFKILQNY